MEQKTAQVTLKSKRTIVDGAQFGVPFWVTPTRARMLIAAGAVDLVGGQVGPAEGKPAGPAENKVFAGVGLVSRSTDSAKSPEPGTDAPSPVSEVVPASPTTSSAPSKPRKGGRRKKSES